ncbi:hypothetical protein [Pleionea sediminis]|uniref:hypothetical protein n=1 Tax=Pleionea sediminis TaxID=2569479 RepID=UPI0013DE47A6|nr:hypothetical protein [Pleionea sediminis]
MELVFQAVLGVLSILFFIWGGMCLGLSIISRRFRHRATATFGTTSVSIGMLLTMVI